MTDAYSSDIPASALILDDRYQLRERLSDAAVADYCWDIEQMPPIDVFDIDGHIFVVDGFHRVVAAQAMGVDLKKIRVHRGTHRDALLFACHANTSHGLRRTPEDKRKVVGAMLDDAEWRLWSDHKIADHCGVSQPFVSKMRKERTLESQNKTNADVGAVSAGPSRDGGERVRGEAEEDSAEQNKRIRPNAAVPDSIRHRTTCPTCQGTGVIQESTVTP